MEDNVCHLFVLTLGLIFVHQTYCLTKPTSVRLVNNEYTGVVFAIHHEEPENEELIEELKEMITSASSYLYEATHHRAYFKEVTILIPETWEDKDEYQLPGKATFRGADVFVAAKNPRYATDPNLPPPPYTKQYEGCGKMGIHIHLTSEFLLHPLTERLFGDKGRMLVHEWAHYRWGLFDEYVNPVDYPGTIPEHFYHSTTNNRYEPIRCTRGYHAAEIIYDKRTDMIRPCEGDANIGYEVGCGSIPFRNQRSVTASIMSGHQSIPQIVNFCDDDDHNNEAPTKHNEQCGGRSNWAVMRDHDDFRNNNNPPREVDNVTPTITLSRPKAARIVLVLDSSGSMSSENRMTKLTLLSRNFILNIAVEGSYVGIVDFDSEGRIKSGLTLIDSQATRERLASRIPDTADGGTCIASGLDKALQILSANDQSPAGGSILLISDGEDGCDGTTGSLRETLGTEGVVVNTVTYSNAADEVLRAIADTTGGKYYLQTDVVSSVGLYHAFVETMGLLVPEEDRRVQMLTEGLNLGNAEPRIIHNGVSIEPGVGENTVFELTYFTGQPDGLEVSATSPSGDNYGSDHPGYTVDRQFNIISINIQSAEPGNWDFQIINPHSGQDVLVSVYAYPSEQGDYPIVVTAELSGTTVNFALGETLTAFVEVRQGPYPVIRANVFAEVERPPDSNGITYPPVKIELLDNGAGADITKDDGIYSRYFTDFTGIGYYGLKIYVENDEDTLILDGTSPLPFSNTLLSLDPDELLKGNIPTIDGRPILVPGMPVPEPQGSRAPNFTRGISGGSSQVPETPENWEPGDDILAPSKITDLSVTSAFYDNGTVILEFTAPGDDLDSGNASYYILRMSTSPAELRNSYTAIPPIDETAFVYGDTSSPGQFGDRELFILSVPVPADEPTVSYAFAMHAVDESGNEGMMSNIAQASLREYIPPPVTHDPTTTSKPTTETPTTTAPELQVCCYYGGMFCFFC